MANQWLSVVDRNTESLQLQLRNMRKLRLLMQEAIENEDWNLLARLDRLSNQTLSNLTLSNLTLSKQTLSNQTSSNQKSFNQTSFNQTFSKQTSSSIEGHHLSAELAVEMLRTRELYRNLLNVVNQKVRYSLQAL